MQLKINHQIKQVSPDITHLFQLLNAEKIATSAGIAVAVDGQIIPRQDWDNFELKNGMDILIITATQGG